MQKVKKLSEVVRAVNAARKKGKTIVTTNGCFDMLHAGHLQSLITAKKFGDVLVVGVNSDKSLQRYKGPKRPIIPERERAKLLGALSVVDYVFIFTNDDPRGWIKKIRPHVHVKGYRKEGLLEAGAVKAVGGVCKMIPLVKGRSTTNTIETILKRYRK